MMILLRCLGRQFWTRRCCILLFVVLSALAVIIPAIVTPAILCRWYPDICSVSPSVKPRIRGMPQLSYVSNWVVLCMDDNASHPLWPDMPPDWRLVVLATTRPRDCSLPECVYLSGIPDFKLRKNQCSLSARAKLSAFLYAFEHGARTVLIRQQSIPAGDWLQGYHVTSTMPGLLVADFSTFEPEVRNDSKPKDPAASLLQFKVSDITRPLIQRRLPRSRMYDVIAPAFDSVTALMTGKNALSPFAVVDTLFLPESLWALPFIFPSAGAEAEEDEEEQDKEWLERSASLVVQRLLHELDAHVAFVSPVHESVSPLHLGDLELSRDNDTLSLVAPIQNASEAEDGDRASDSSNSSINNGKSCSNCTTPPSPSALNTTSKAGGVPPLNMSLDVDILMYLRHWQCPPFIAFHACAENLLARLAGRYLSKEKVNTIRTSFYRMSALGYVFPRRIIPGSAPSRPLTSVLYSPASAEESWRHLKPISVFCPNVPNPLPPFTPLITDVALVVTFTSADCYGNFLYLNAIHRPYFQHVLFCGPKISQIHKCAQDRLKSEGFLFAESSTEGSDFLYECMAIAMAMNFRVRGYLQITRDTLVSSWQLSMLPRDKIWLSAIRWERDIDSTNDGYFNWWNDTKGRHALKKVLAEIDSQVRSPRSVSDDDLARNVRSTFYTNAKSMNVVFGQTPEFFYIPERVRTKYVFLSKLYLEHRVIGDLAVVNIILSLDLKEDIHFLPFEDSQWYDPSVNLDGNKSNTSWIYAHPFKVTSLRNKHGRRFFCHTYIRPFIRNLF